jgi:GT2 family glycosyltransferase
MSFPAVLVAILNYNRKDDLLKCVCSVLKQDYPNCAVVVVDNKSSDNSMRALIDNYGDRIGVISNERNLGTAGGYNVCIGEALRRKVQYVLLLNNDVVLEKDTLSELVKVATHLPKMGLLGPKVYFRDSGEIWSCGGTVNSWLGKTSHITEELSRAPKAVDYIPGAAMLISLEAVEEVGNFDEHYFMYWEDVDYCTRMKRCGYENVVVTQSVVHHRVGCVEGQYTPLTTYYPLRNRFLYAEKHIRKREKPIFHFYSAILLFQKLSAIVLGRIFKHRPDSPGRMKAVFMAYWDWLRGRYGRRV